MKLLAKIMGFLMLLLLFTCTNKINNNSNYKINFTEIPTNSNFDYKDYEDAIVVVQDSDTLLYVLSVEKFKCGISEPLKLTLHSCHLLKGELTDCKIFEITESDVDFFPKYLNNTLHISDINQDKKNEIMFFYSKESVFGGLDPLNIKLIIVEDNEIYQFEGKIPVHEDWEWKSHYKFSSAKELQEKSIDVYNLADKVWHKFISNYKNNCYLQF